MTNQEIDKLKQMLQSNNEADINLAGSVIHNLPEYKKHLYSKDLAYLFDKEDWKDILESKYSVENRLNRYLQAIFFDRQARKDREIVLWTSQQGAEEFDKLMKEEANNFLNNDTTRTR